VWLTEVGTPVASSDGQNGQFGDDDGCSNGGCDFLGGLDAETDVALGVSNDNDCLESSSLTGTSLLLDRLDLSPYVSILPPPPVVCLPYLHDLVLQLGQEEIHNLVLLDGEGMQVDLLHALNLAGLDESTELGDWLPLLLFLVASSSCTSSTASSAATSVSSASVAEAASATVTATASSWCVSHNMCSVCEGP